jgi:hypothetical protein
LAARICIHLTYGAPLEVAAQAEGVSAASLRRWQHRHPAFREKIEQARAQCVVACLGYLYTAAERGDWHVAAWLLERIAPERYGPSARRLALPVDGDDLDVTQMSDDELVALLARLPREQQCPVARLLPAPDHAATHDGSNGHHHPSAPIDDALRDIVSS